MIYNKRVKDLITRGWAHPNSLTLFRVAAVPLIVLLLLYDNRISSFFAALMFTLAAITDYLDGWIARSYGLTSNLGKILDPLADKLLVSSAFIMLIPHGRVPAWMICIIIGRELAVTGLRNLIAERGDDASASQLGKYKTGFQIAALIPLLIHYPYFGVDLHVVGSFFLWLALVITVWSGVDYFVRFWKYIED